MINILPIDIYLNINSFLNSKDNIYFLTSCKYTNKFLHKTLDCNITQNLLQTEEVFPLFPNKFNHTQKIIYKKEFFRNIPKSLNTIHKIFFWFYVHNQLIKYYNISFLWNNRLLITSNKKLTKNEIYLELKKKLKFYINNHNASMNSCSKIIENNNISTSKKYWYHQVDYTEFINISYEIFIEI